VFIVSLFAVLLLASPGTASAATCTKVASPGSGSAQRLVDSLSAGQTGCLHGGTYDEGSLTFDKGGAPGAPITLTSYPGERARIAGGVYVPNGSDHVTIHTLDIDGSGGGGPTVQIMGADTVLSGNLITNRNSAESCVILGSLAGYGQARGTSIRANRFADCGDPANGIHDHGIYIENSVGAEVVDNLFWHAAAWAIQLYPNAQGTRIAHNVMDGSAGGVIISGESAGGEYSQDYASSGTVIEQNLLTNATAEYNVQSWWGGPRGTGNLVHSNCVAGGAKGNIDTSDGGFTATANATADPQYVDRAAHDYRMKPGSPCLSVVGYDTAAKLAGGDTGEEPGPGAMLPGLPVSSPSPATTTSTRALIARRQGPRRLRSLRPRFRITVRRPAVLRWSLRTGKKKVLARGTRKVTRARTITLRPRVSRRELRRFKGHRIRLVLRARPRR
jgi:hypothetical protein